MNLWQLSGKKGLVFATLLIVPLLVFLKCIFFGFTLMDEQWLILQRQSTYESWSGISILFRSPLLSMFYRPVLTTSFLVDYQIAGLDTRMYHLSNLLIHLLCVLTLFRLLRYFDTERPVALLLSLFFGVHPMVVHAVAWVPGRNDTLLCLFSLLSLYGLMRFLKEGAAAGAVLHLSAFAMALLTKESAVTLIAVFAAAWFIYGKWDRRLLPALGIWLAMIVSWYWVKRSIVDVALHHGGVADTAAGFTKALLIYFGKAVLPVRQWIMPTLQNSVWYTGVIAVVLISLLAAKTGIRNRKIAFSGLVIVLALLALPVWFSLSSNQGELYEHRFYTPLAGFVLFMSQLKINYRKPATGVISILIIVVFAGLSSARAEAYRSAMSYTDEGIRCCPDRYGFYAHKGYLLSDQGKFEEAVPYYSRAIALMPRNYKNYLNRAAAFVELGRRDEALADLQAAEQINYKPEILIARYQAFLRFGDMASAQKAKADIDAYYGGKVQGTRPEDLRRWNEDQLKELNRMLAAQPGNALLYVNRAKVYMDLRMGREALRDLKTACELEPSNAHYQRYYEELNSSLPR